MRLSARLSALLALVALLLAALLQGRPYVRCAMDGALHLVACCQVTAWQDGQAFDDPACCETLVHDAVAPSTPPERLAPLALLALVPPAPLVVPPAPLAWVAPPRPPRAEPPPSRAGPPPPPLAHRLARLSRLLS